MSAHPEASTATRDGMDLLVLGAGRLGTVLGAVAASNGRRAVVWTRREAVAVEISQRHTHTAALPGVALPVRLGATTDLASAVRAAPALLLAVPSEAFRQVARAAGEAIEGDHVVVHATKGLEVGSFLRMSQVLREETCALKLGVLSGPTLAEEIGAGRPAGALLASHYDEVITRVQAIFRGSHLRVYGGRDVVGAEVGAAFATVVAVAAGAVDGLGLGDNAKWLIVTRGLNEMAQLGVAMGADALTFGGLAGVGDLAATCASPLSPSHQIGYRLARGERLAEILGAMPGAAEAVPTSEAIHRHAAESRIDLPIARAVHGLLHEGWSIDEAMDRLMAVPVGLEVVATKRR